MKHFTIAQVAEIDAASDTCKATAEALNGAIDAYNEALNEHIEALKDAKEAYNDALAGLREIIEGLHSTADEYMSERSERWQEGENGQEYARWVESMEGINELENLDFDMPEALEQPDLPDWEDKTFLPKNSPDE